MVRNQLPAQVVNLRGLKRRILTTIARRWKHKQRFAKFFKSLSLSLSLSPSPTNKRYQYSSDCRRGSALHFYLPLSSVYHYHDRLFVLRGEGEAFLPNVCCESTLGARSCLTVWLSQSREERFWTVYVCIYLPARRAQVLSFLKCCLSRVRYHTSRGFNLR